MRRARPARISLLLADVDGTLVTHDKVLTERARAAVHRLHEQGICFAITSGRPPRGMVMLTDPLRIDTAIAAFNGGIFVEPDLTVIDSHALPPKVSETAVGSLPSTGSRPARRSHQDAVFPGLGLVGARHRGEARQGSESQSRRPVPVPCYELRPRSARHVISSSTRAASCSPMTGLTVGAD